MKIWNEAEVHIAGLQCVYGMLRYWPKIFLINWKARQELSLSFQVRSAIKKRHHNYSLGLKLNNLNFESI